jgi:hypothetical protein
MMRIEATARRAINEADEHGKNAKSIKLPGPVMERMYLKGWGTKPQHQFLVCAKCGHPLVDELPFNKDYYWNNKTLEGEWLNMNRQMQEYLVTKCNPLLDKKGAIITAIKNPTYQEEVLICHCWHNFQSPIAGGTGCALKCYDSKAKKTVSCRQVTGLYLLLRFCLHKEVSLFLMFTFIFLTSPLTTLCCLSKIIPR